LNYSIYLQLFMKNILILTVLIIVAQSCNSFYSKKKFGKGELFYTTNVSIDDVIKTGNFLYEMNYFNKNQKNSILLDKSQDTFFIQIVVDKLYHADTSNDFAFRSLAHMAELSIFSGKKCFVELTDRSLNVKRRIH
jgi:hypothetical protein